MNSFASRVEDGFLILSFSREMDYARIPLHFLEDLE
jgi:hypothetical protein